MDKPKVFRQGKVIVEYDYTERCYYIMTSDGSVFVETIKSEALRTIRKWFKKNADKDAMNVGTIEWRDCPTRRS
jgi:hypothetical protein